MEFFDRPLAPQEIIDIRQKYGGYVKLTVDIENAWVIVGSELHADGEKVLLEKGSNPGNIWGGGLNLKDKQIDTTAVLNIRPRLDNDNLEILDSVRREKFLGIIRSYFQKAWK